MCNLCISTKEESLSVFDAIYTPNTIVYSPPRERQKRKCSRKQLRIDCATEDKRKKKADKENDQKYIDPTKPMKEMEK